MNDELIIQDESKEAKPPGKEGKPPVKENSHPLARDVGPQKDTRGPVEEGRPPSGANNNQGRRSNRGGKPPVPSRSTNVCELLWVYTVYIMIYLVSLYPVMN